MSNFTETLNMLKKAAPQDWHKADIIAAVRKTGTSLREMSRSLGLVHSALGNALHYPAPRYERIIAERLNTTPQQIWPSRYHDDGSPKSGRGERGLGRYKAKHKFNASAKNSNVNALNNADKAA